MHLPISRASSERKGNMRVRLPYKKGGPPRALEKKEGNRIFHIKEREYFIKESAVI